jgi:peroxiredoxin (alkyl hydroperoxide reductase subunit C)
MIHANTNSTKNVRGVFIIDPKNKVRSVNFYPMEIGRNMDEVKRAVIAMQKADKDMVYTPANWNPGDDVIVPYQKAVADAGKISEDPNADSYKVSWYMIFKKSK